MNTVEEKIQENEKKLRKAKAFAVLSILLVWLSIFIAVWAIFSGNGLLPLIGGLIGDKHNYPVIILAIQVIFYLPTIIIFGFIRIKTCANVFNVKKIDSILKYNIKTEDTGYLSALAYLDRMSETMLIAFWMALNILLTASLFTEVSMYSPQAWTVVLIGLAFSYLFPQIYWKIICNNRFSWALFIDSVIDIFKIAFIIILLSIAINHGFQFAVRISEIESSAWVGSSAKFDLYMLQIVRGILRVVCLAVISIGLVHSLQTVVQTYAKRMMIWIIILTVIDIVIYMIMPSNLSITIKLGEWFDAVRLWWLPIIILLIAMQISVKFPKGKDVFDDIRQVLKKNEIEQTEKKAEQESILEEKEENIEAEIKLTTM